MYTIIDSLEDLDFLNNELLDKPYLGVDTEFRRTNKYNMQLALLQVNDSEETYLIDTLCIKNPYESASFLFSDSVVKIFHSCKEDLEAVYSWTNNHMENIFDTQLANSFLKDNYSISYQSLVEQELQINLDKKETRSNWIRRPLSDAQLKYAALDVEYLIHLYLIQFNLLKSSKKLNWLQQDINRLINTTFNPDLSSANLERTISKNEEFELLKELNEIVIKIASDKKINSTMLFPKKSQKDFLRLIFHKGIDFALNSITDWRSSLIRKDLEKLLK